MSSVHKALANHSTLKWSTVTDHISDKKLKFSLEDLYKNLSNQKVPTDVFLELQYKVVLEEIRSCLISAGRPYLVSLFESMFFSPVQNTPLSEESQQKAVERWKHLKQSLAIKKQKEKDIQRGAILDENNANPLTATGRKRGRPRKPQAIHLV